MQPKLKIRPASACTISEFRNLYGKPDRIPEPRWKAMHAWLQTRSPNGTYDPRLNDPRTGHGDKTFAEDHADDTVLCN